MSMKALRKALRRKAEDEFEDGTVIRWTLSLPVVYQGVTADRTQDYQYAALKTPVGWITTARVAGGSARVPKTVTWEGLLRVLTRPEASNVKVAAAWENVL